ncbi:hypothetical protein N184_29045 [Sinorhizobium sp. GL28]|nr:hypothetical protein N184_29045 [Sinorhizobium sp. GL28]
MVVPPIIKTTMSVLIASTLLDQTRLTFVAKVGGLKTNGNEPARENGMANSLLLFGGIFVLFHAFEPNGVLVSNKKSAPSGAEIEF